MKFFFFKYTSNFSITLSQNQMIQEFSNPSCLDVLDADYYSTVVLLLGYTVSGYIKRMYLWKEQHSAQFPSSVSRQCCFCLSKERARQLVWLMCLRNLYQLNLKFSQSCSEELCITCSNVVVLCDAVHCTPSFSFPQNISERSQRCSGSPPDGDSPRKRPAHST